MKQKDFCEHTEKDVILLSMSKRPAPKQVHLCHKYGETRLLVGFRIHEHLWISSTTKCMSHFMLKMFLSWLYQKGSFLKSSTRRPGISTQSDRKWRTWKANHSNCITEKNPSTAGFLLSENHTLKPHDSSIITMNLNRINQIEKSAQEVKEKMKKDLQSAVLASGKIKDGRKTSHKFDQDIISDMCELKTSWQQQNQGWLSLGRKPRIYSKLTLELSGESRVPKSKTNTVQQKGQAYLSKDVWSS